MRCCANAPERPAWLLTLLLTLMPAAAHSTHDDTATATILYLHHYVEEETLRADLRLRPHLSRAMLAALRHAITLHFLTRLRLVEHTRLSGLFPMHRIVAEARFSLRLDYLPEKRLWRLTNLNSGRVRHYGLLDEALDTLGTYTGIRLAPLAQLHPGIRYTIETRFMLQRSRLPAPLWLQSLGEAAWRLDSGWYRTDVDPRKLWQR